MPLYERLFPRWKPKRELRPQGREDGWGARITGLGTAGVVIESPETTRLIGPFVTRPGLPRIAKRMVPYGRAIARHVPSNVDYHEPIRVPPNDARGAVLAAG